MTDITYQITGSNLNAQSTGYLTRIAAFCGQLIEGAHDGQQMAARYHELSRLSGADLAARGLTRDMVSRAVLTGH